MGLNSDDGDIVGMGETQSEQASEQAREQAREKAAQAIADLKSTQRDEKKARVADDVLAKILADLLESGKSDFILIQVTPLLQNRVPSHILEGILSLLDWKYIGWCGHSIDTPIPDSAPSYVSGEEIIEYTEPLPSEIHEYLNIWFEIVQGLLTKNPSKLARHAFKQKAGDETIKQKLIEIMGYVFGEFLYTHKIKIPKSKAISYGEYVVHQLIKWSS